MNSEVITDEADEADEMDIEIVDYALEAERNRIDKQNADTGTMTLLLNIIQYINGVKDDQRIEVTVDDETKTQTTKGRELDPFEEDIHEASLKTLKIMVGNITKKAD